MTTPKDEYLTVKEVEALAKVSRQTIWRWCGKGRLRQYRVVAGGAVRFKKSEVIMAMEVSQFGGEEPHDAAMW